MEMKYFILVFCSLFLYSDCSDVEDLKSFLIPVSYNKADTIKTDVKYMLFNNKEDVGRGYTENSIKIAAFRRDRPTKFFIHDHKSNYSCLWYYNLKEAYHKRAAYNVFFVDWGKTANKTYSVAAGNVKRVGDIIGDFIIASKLGLNNIHLIGHSMGAMVAAFIGKRIQEKTNNRIYRITALDPAGPKFESVRLTKNMRLCDEDANFVDVIHTDAGHYGYTAPIGHVDYYPNGGFSQPGCPPPSEDVDCSHESALEYYIETVTTPKYTAVLCTSWQMFRDGKCEENHQLTFGEDADIHAKGTYFFSTTAQKPIRPPI